MKLKKKRCEYHKRDCFIWKNYKGMRFCKQGWLLYERKELDVQNVSKLLDALVRVILLVEKPSRCFTCDYIPKDKRELQVGHFISRANHSVRWDLENVELQCQRCNCELLGNLVIFEERLGSERVESLKEKNKVTKLSLSDLEEILESLKKRRDNVSLC